MILSDDIRNKAREILTRPETLGTPALTLCLKLLGPESLDWEPEIFAEGVSKLIRTPAHSDVLQRAQAAASLLLNDSFFQLVPVFHGICSTLLDPDERPDLMTKFPAPLELAWSCYEAHLLIGRTYNSEHFTASIRRYCALALLDEDLRSAPPELAFADFPADKYPDPTLMGDETLASAFWKDQEDRLAEIKSAMDTVKKAYRTQLLELRPFGVEEKTLKLIEKA